MRRVLVLNGPNLNLLGSREPHVYGSTSLTELERHCAEWGAAHNLEVDTYQSNHEGALIDRLHEARETVDGIVFNPGALTHYSYALHDAVEAIDPPVVEVHISNIRERESWRAHSVIGPAAAYTIYGRGLDGYRWAIEHLVHTAARPPITLSYAAGADHVADLRLPDGSGPHPVAVLIHGGFWRHHWTRDTTGALAVDLCARGFATWNIEYRRVGTGGGYPSTLQDVALAVDHLDELAAEYRLDLGRVVAIGHSAGGQLALWTAGRHRLAAGDPGSDPRILPAAAVSLAGVTNLEAAEVHNIGEGAVAAFLGKAPRDEAYRVASPIRLLPADRPHLIVHGTRDDLVPAAQAHEYAEAARHPGTKVELVELVDTDHFDPIDAAGPAWASVVERIESF